MARGNYVEIAGSFPHKAKSSHVWLPFAWME
jgi:hypothetical protein